MTVEIEVLVFDVFGTVVDWRGSIIKEGEQVWKEQGVNIDWAAFADVWRSGYKPAMDRIRRGEVDWATIDTLHRRFLRSCWFDLRCAF